MYFITAEIKLTSDQSLDAIAKTVSDALNIPDFIPDESGRYEELSVLVSEAFGFSFGLCQPEGYGGNDYELSIEPSLETPEFGDDRVDIDLTKYALWLLRDLQNVVVVPSP